MNQADYDHYWEEGWVVIEGIYATDEESNGCLRYITVLTRDLFYRTKRWTPMSRIILCHRLN
jgi:hypothetical protein